jgi:hypothetical protein
MTVETGGAPMCRVPPATDLCTPGETCERPVRVPDRNVPEGLHRYEPFARGRDATCATATGDPCAPRG